MKPFVRRGWLLWLAVLAAVTLAMLPLRGVLEEAHVALAYLLVVQGAGAWHGRRAGLVVAGLAFLCLDILFLPPYGTLVVERPIDWLVLVAFLAVATIAAHHANAMREASRVKDAVLASVSHDLRTPLTTIKALAHDLAAGDDDRAMTIEEEADRLDGFVRDLLDLSRLGSGAVALSPEPNEAEDLVGAALQRVSGAANGREIRVSLGEGEPLRFGRFDFAQTLRALVNLLENALKYSPPGASIDVTVRRDGRWLAFAVADRGPGIPPAERLRIFEPFYRRPDTPSDVRGVGLGLSIARGVVEAQGGSLSYEAREGGGSVFTIRVPAIDVEQAAAVG